MKNIFILTFILLLCSCEQKSTPKNTTIVIDKIKITGGDAQYFEIYYTDINTGIQDYYTTSEIEFNVGDTVIVP